MVCLPASSGFVKYFVAKKITKSVIATLLGQIKAQKNIFFATKIKAKEVIAMADGDVLKTEYTVLLQSDGVSRTRMSFPSGITIANLKTFLDKYCGAAIIGLNKLEKLECAHVAAKTGALVDDKLIITYRNAATQEVGRFVIPAYDKGTVTLVFDDSREGKRLSKSSGDLLITDYKTCISSTDNLIFLNGTPTRIP